VLPLALTLLTSQPSLQDSSRAFPPDAYADSTTAALVARARAARDRNERLVTAYTATVSQRIGVGIRALSRDRMLYRQELVARIAWKRDAPSTVEVVGAREGIPVVMRGDQIPEELDEQVRSLVLNPAEDYLRVIGARDEDGFVYPLRQGGERDYRFATGDSTVIRLPTGRRIRLLSLEVTPRRSDWRLIAGSLWYDADTYGLVRAVFRPARPFEFRRDVDPEDRDDVPGWVNPTGEVKFVTLEYGFYEDRWWLPRYVAIDAAGAMGSWLGVPVKIERVYDDYEVEGGTPPQPGSTFRPAGSVRRREPDREASDSAVDRRVADSVAAAVRDCVERETARWRDSTGGNRRGLRMRIRRCSRRDESDNSLVVVVPPDTAALLVSPTLGPPILDLGDLLSEGDLRSLSDAIDQLPSRRWDPRLDLPRGLGTLFQHARYNRIEALSVGAAGALDLGPLTLRGTARLGLADLVPNGELSLVQTTPTSRVSLSAYRRLAAANPDVHPFGAVNSVLGLVAQRDDGEYYRTLGAELVGQNANAGWWRARVYLQRERPAAVETSVSLPRLFEGGRVFRPNIVADSATQAGASLTLRANEAVSRTLTVGAETTLEGATGDFDFARAAATLRVIVTPAGPFAGAASVSAGTSTGTVPVQGRFYLGGAGTLRGYSGGVLAGSAFWAARVEVANSFPAARLTAFSDVGWAGDRADFTRGRPLIGAGVGASFLDGLVRIDLARGLRAPTGWRLELYFDGVI
jgi:hypothetical protein